MRLRALDVESNMGLVANVAHRYRWALRDGLELDDLMQAGAIGLMKAIERFDPSRGIAFATYAVWWIRHGIQREVESHSSTIRKPTYLRQECRRTGAPLPAQTVSADAPLGANEARSMLDVIAADDRSALDLADAESERRAVQAAMAALPERLRFVVRARFFREHTLEQVGTALGITRERARQLEVDALRRLGRSLKGVAA